MVVLSACDLEDLVELFLDKRLAAHADSLQLCQDEVQAAIAARTMSPGALARAHLVGASTKAFESHCEQVLADLLRLVQTLGDGSCTEAMGGLFQAHLEAAAGELVHRLCSAAHASTSATSAERNRVSNLVTSLRRRMTTAWNHEVERSSREQLRAADLETAASDLDDRLPLGRRGVFDQDLVRLAARAGPDESLALIMIDIDHFKRVNDEHGHPVGDEVLMEVAQAVVRRVAHKGKAYRYGGEELAVLLPTYSTEEAAGLAERLRKDLEATTFSSRDLRLSASFGVASLPSDVADARSLLERADAALYGAKSGGRNRVCTASTATSTTLP